MNLQPAIEALEAEAADLRQKLSWVEEALGLVRKFEARPAPPLDVPRSTLNVRRSKPEKPEKPEHRTPNSERPTSKRKGVSTAMLDKQRLRAAAIERCGKTFTAEEVIEKGKLPDTDARTLACTLENWVVKGWLAIHFQGRGGHSGTATQYRRSLGWKTFLKELNIERSTASAERPKEERPKTNPPGEFILNRAEPARRLAVLHLLNGWEGAHPVSEIVERMRAEHPDLMKNDPAGFDLRAQLLELAGRGRIKSVGTGAGRHYSRTVAAAYQDLRKTVPVPARDDDNDNNISVPRDADAGK